MKTSLIGIIGALCYGAYSAIASGSVSAKDIILSAIIAGLGIFSHDSNKPIKPQAEE